MAKKQTKQTANNRKSANTPNKSRPRTGGAADFTQQRKAAPAPKQAAQPKPAKREPKDPPSAGSILWRLALILCVGLVIFSLLFASINGGSRIIGVTDQKDSATPTPPVADATPILDPNVNITGSDATPIPPSPTPGVDATTTTDGNTDGTWENPTP